MKRGYLAGALILSLSLVFSACGSTKSSDSKAASVGEDEETGADENNTDDSEDNAENAETDASDTEEINSASEDLFAMDTYMTVTAYGEYADEAVAEAVAEIEMLDELLSTGSEDSEISMLNAAGGATLSDTTAYLFERAEELYEMTNGVFDISIYPVMKLWGFADQDFAVPEEDELLEALALVNMDAVEYDASTKEIVFTVDGTEIDMGGIVKGYAAERIKEIFDSYEIVSGVVNLGGDCWTYSTKIDGSDWRVGIQDPDDSSAYIGIVSVSDVSVVTSGDYERYFEEDGVRYHHIVDPSTGYPADNGLRSVTVISRDGTLADGLSTSVFIMGVDKASDFWREYSDVFDMIMMEDDGSMYVTEGIADSFTSDLDYEIIEK